MSSLIVVGAGGHGREVADVAEAAGYALLGFVDDADIDAAVLLARGSQLLGSTAFLSTSNAVVLLGVGDPVRRGRLADRLTEVRWGPAVVHPHASLGTRVSLGQGTVVAAGARLTTEIAVGAHCYVGPNATVGHDVAMGDFATVLPGATIGGAVALGRSCTVGTGANVRQGIRVGDDAIVGAGAVVLSDVPAGATVVGVPARSIAGSSG